MKIWGWRKNHHQKGIYQNMEKITFDEKTKNDIQLRSRLRHFSTDKIIERSYGKLPSLSGYMNGEKFLAFEGLNYLPSIVTIIQNTKCIEYNREDDSHMYYVENSEDEQGWKHELRVNEQPNMQAAIESIHLETPKGKIVLQSRVAEDKDDFRTESKVILARKDLLTNYLLRAVYNKKTDYIQQKSPIRIILIMDDGKERIETQYSLQEDGQYLVEYRGSEENMENTEETTVSLEGIKKLIENKQISFEMPKFLEEYIAGGYGTLEEVEAIAEEIQKRKLDKNTMGEEMEH